MGKRGIRGLKAKMAWECCISRGAQMARLSSGGIQAGGVRRGIHSVGRNGISRRSRDATGRAAPGVRQPRALNLEKESSEHFK